MGAFMADSRLKKKTHRILFIVHYYYVGGRRAPAESIGLLMFGNGEQ